MPVRLLCVGDIHLGRWPSGLPDAVVERAGTDRLTPAAAWKATVEEALSRGVDAVLLAGDVVDEDRDFYEAYGELEAGVRRLAEAGIPTAGVAGNHDVAVLPRLADTISDFTLLGRGGTWEVMDIRSGDGTVLRVAGWSFPRKQVRESPLQEPLPLDRADGIPTVGLLHCDRDQAGSPYAPVRSAELANAPLDAWLLGHIHRPDPLDGERPVGYLGSLTGLDPGEHGARGPWLLCATGSGVTMEQIPLAPLRWERLAVDVQELAGPEEVHSAIIRRIDQLAADLEAADYCPLAVGCRIRLHGRSPFRRELKRVLDGTSPEELVWTRGANLTCFVERVIMEVQPAADIEALATGSDPVALVAHQLLVLRRDVDNPERRELVSRARDSLRDVAMDSRYAPLRPEVPDDEQTAVRLEQAAIQALDELLAQREDPQ